MSSPAADPLRTRDAAAVAEPPSDHLDALLRAISDQRPGPQPAALRDQVIRLLVPLARRVARRFQGHGEDFDDLVQVASLGLVKAVDGYDPARGHAFLSYAIPTITGELRRHLRDRTCAVRLPRSLREASAHVFQAVEDLEQRLGGRSPTTRQIAEHTGLEHGQVLSALRTAHECRLRSLEEPMVHDQASPLACLIGAEDTALGRVVDTLPLASLMKRLPEQGHQVLYLRFYREQTQRQIADVIGVSQMQVSRILRRCFDRLTEGFLGTGPFPVRSENERRTVGHRAARSTHAGSCPDQAATVCSAEPVPARLGGQCCGFRETGPCRRQETGRTCMRALGLSSAPCLRHGVWSHAHGTPVVSARRAESLGGRYRRSRPCHGHRRSRPTPSPCTRWRRPGDRPAARRTETVPGPLTCREGTMRLPGQRSAPRVRWKCDAFYGPEARLFIGRRPARPALPLSRPAGVSDRRRSCRHAGRQRSPG
ncbi:sigma-70 family RNA polymerase sigma factor [Streptomyces sp. NPDC057438]|uniref:sigma-70 family RNA polymerase sigma factor n=1 Tax=Streptomyces sp. NPDC057438 TaxID=3346133 RepID=UPI003699ECDE